MARVFNLSHHKCGTTSVHSALGILGFKSHHWEDPDHLMRVHLEGRVTSEPRFREDNTAWNDLPISLMYRALFETYAAAVFLFVRRDPASWLDSIRRHMGTWPGELAMHTLVYGYAIKTSNFDERVCLRVYDRFCQDVLEFFAGKPNFHLIEFKDLSWKTLCKAVNKPEPEIPFPWENRSVSP